MLAMMHPTRLVHTIIFWGVPVISGWLIYACKKWSYWVYMCLMAVPFIYSYMSWSETQNSLPLSTLIGFYALNSAVVIYFLLPSVRRVYFDAKLRWWETKPRFGTSYQAPLTIGEDNFEGQIRNISEGGIFWESKDTIPLNTELTIEFVGSYEKFKLKGQALYRRDIDPAGYGIKFNLDPVNEDRILLLIARLKDEGAVLVSRVPGPEDSFTAWLRSLIRSRSAWVPQPVSRPLSTKEPTDLALKNGTDG